MATRASNTAAIDKSTNRSWDSWLAFLKSIGAEKLSHKEIAERILATGDVSGWWAQSITVAYEQHIGRRVPGQDCDGEFQVSATKTFSGTMDEALAAWVALVGDRKSFSDIAITRGAETSKSEKFRYWRCGLEDGSRVDVSIYQKTPGKASIGLGHERLGSEAQVEHWRAFWKELLAGL
jgi:hypothetical protein